jgi:putative sigma-54 modulation protein
MDLQIKPHGVALTGELQGYIDRKLGRLDRYLDRVTDAKLELRDEQRRTGGIKHIAQLTIATSFALLRAEEEAADIHAAVDAVAIKMERQIVRYRSKWKSRRHNHHGPAPELPDAETIDDAEEPATSGILRTKSFSSKPVDPDEAVEQMELLGHEFFAFINARTGVVNVVYKRRSGGYGLLQPQS